MTTSREVSHSLLEEIKVRRSDPREIRYLSWGFSRLDKLTGGIRPQTLSILGAETGAGKSFLLGQVVTSVARAMRADSRFDGKVIRVVHCEMTVEQFQERLLVPLSGIPKWKIEKGRLNDDEYRQVYAAANELAKLPIEYLESPRSVDDTVSFVERDGNCAFWAVDHMLIHQIGRSGLSPLDMRGLGVLSEEFRELAKRSAPGLVLHQLTNDVAKREDHRPNKGDLFGGKVIQQDMHLIMLLYRPDVYRLSSEDSADSPKPAHLIVDKNRHGGIGDVPLTWMPSRLEFAERA